MWPSYMYHQNGHGMCLSVFDEALPRDRVAPQMTKKTCHIITPESRSRA